MGRAPEVVRRNPDERANDTLIFEAMHELITVAGEIDGLRAQRPPAPQVGGYMDATGGFGARTKRLCYALGQASTALFEDSALRNAADNRERQRRMERVRGICAGIDIAPLADRAMRNRIVHFDEHLGRQFRRFPRSSMISNMGLSNRTMLRPEEGSFLLYSRVYIFEEDRLLHLDTELDLAAVRRAAVLTAIAIHTTLPPEWIMGEPGPRPREPLPDFMRLDFMAPRRQVPARDAR